MELLPSILRTIVFLALIKNTNAFTIKNSDGTIVASDGDVVECVDRMKQIAFNNPLLKSHKFQESPSEFPITRETKQKSKWETDEADVSTAKCPEGTVPVRRGRATVNRTEPGTATYSPKHEYAVVIKKTPPKLYGAKGTINVWDPAIEKGTGEMSISQIWITSGEYTTNDVNTIEIGWQVLPKTYLDNKPRLFIYWTSDTYVTGCYNLECPGFIQTSSSIVLGGSISPISSFGGSQYEITILVWKGNWWLSLGPNNSVVGYWPAEIFTTLADHAYAVEWGGEIINSRTFGQHTTTQMGSGHFPDEGFEKSNYICNLEVVDDTNNMRRIENFTKVSTNPDCYNVQDVYTPEGKTCIFYGGPGFRPTH